MPNDKRRGVDSMASERTTSDLDQAAAMFLSLRPRLYWIAYRRLASVGEAEDMVQEAWLRWQTTDRTIVINPPAFLATTTNRLAINVAQSARRRREVSSLPRIAEPADPHAGPEKVAEQGEELDRAISRILSNLTPTERAVYLLREAFDYPHRQISEILELGVGNVRQILRRAHLRIAADQRRQTVTPASHRSVLQAFLSASEAGNLIGLIELLAADIIRPPTPCPTGRTMHPASV